MRPAVLLAGLLLTLPPSPPGMPAHEANNCTASFDGNQLTISNRLIERRWRLVDGHLYATSILGATMKTNWLTGIAADPQRQDKGNGEYTFSSRWMEDPVEQKSFLVELKRKDDPESGYRFRIFPDAAAISIQLLGKPPDQSSRLLQKTSSEPSGIESDTSASAKLAEDAGAQTLEILPLLSQHLKLTQVELYDQTDIHNELVHERSWLMQANESLHLAGNLFVLEDTSTGAGLIFLKEAPLPHARPDKSNSDLQFDAVQNRVILNGGAASPDGAGYRFTTLLYASGSTGVTRALHQYQREIRPYVPGREGMFLSNTWGDRSRDARINDTFMRGEVEAGARLGVDVIQVDDGWQQGRTKNSATAGGVWNGFWAADGAFWNVNNNRFPQGLEPVVALARKHDMGFGLWFAPDSSNDFANWERDASRLLELHRKLGINYFKIDGVKATSRVSEVRLRSFFDQVLKGSEGRVVFDLDVTAEIRPGYFGAMNVGPLFVENRYTDRRSYWPHQTLRNLWSLARYVDPSRLRMEFLNNARNQNLYANDPLAPATYLPAYLFATTMVANPLGWFETSALPATYFQDLPPIVNRWKKERARLHGGEIFPIGDQPDGLAWTGFLSLDRASGGGYVLAFRERNSSDRWSTGADGLVTGMHKLTLLGGSGSGRIVNGRVDVTIPGSLGFAWFRIEP